MVRAAAAAHGVLLQVAQAGRGLAGVEDDRVRTRRRRRRSGCVSVAVPQRRWRKFSATRSPWSSARTGPFDGREVARRVSNASPSATRASIRTTRRAAGTTSAATVMPASTPASFARKTARPRRAAATVASVVTSSAARSSREARSSRRSRTTTRARLGPSTRLSRVGCSRSSHGGTPAGAASGASSRSGKSLRKCAAAALGAAKGGIEHQTGDRGPWRAVQSRSRRRRTSASVARGAGQAASSSMPGSSAAALRSIPAAVPHQVLNVGVLGRCRPARLAMPSASVVRAAQPPAPLSMCSTTRLPNTTVSISELLASRFAPWTPVQAHFAAGVEARERRPAPDVRPDAAHEVVGGGRRRESARVRMSMPTPMQKA